MSSNLSPEQIRSSVERTYAKAAAPSIATRLAGYTEAQLATMPEGVAFFGCGNPLAYAQVRSGQTVLDLGSGAGFDLILAGRAVGPTGRVIGIDMTDSMIERARLNIDRAGLSHVEVRKGLIEALPVEDSSIDWVISNCVISLSPEKDRVFREIARVLRPGGRMSISDIVVDDRLEWVLRRVEAIVPSIAMARTEPEYLDAILRAGLEEGEIADRFVYQAGDLLGLFGEDLLGEAASACPVAAIGRRARRSAAARGVLRLAARGAKGHVWSAKFLARRGL
jgi:arsenite methyltransferase